MSVPTYRVLIVDDSRFMRKIFSDMIDANEVFTVAATASDGEEAVRLALKLQPDIITMDMEMPRMNGLEALRRIMAARPTPVIMLSAVTDNGTRETIKALQYGAFDFIHKPDGAANQDLLQVGGQLLEKLHVAAESLRTGTFRMMPAVEEEGETSETANTAAKQAVSVPDKPATDAAADNVTPPAAAAPAKQQRAKPAQKPLAAAILPGRDAAGLDKPPAHSPRPAAPAPAQGGAATPPSLPGPAERRTRKTDTAPPMTSAGGGHPAGAAAKNIGRPVSPEPAKPKTEKSPRPAPLFSQIVAIGTSTGGPRALHEVLTGLPAGFEAPVLVVQHMPPKFTHSLAQRLDSFCAIRVREAEQGEAVEAATAYIAPGGKQMSLAKVAGTYRIKLSEEGPRSGHMPSVDYLFESLIGHRELRRHVVLMTGMGSDGAKAMKALQQDGVATLIAESEETCVVYGMPRSAVELGAVSQVLPLQRIAPALVQEVKAIMK